MSACARKTAFASAEAAQAAADRANGNARLSLLRRMRPKNKRPTLMIVYPCPFGLGHFHIGHSSREPLDLDGPLPALTPKRQFSDRENRARGRAKQKLIPACERKRSFSSWMEAEAAALALMDGLAGARRPGPRYVVAHLCRCGAWHCRLLGARRRRPIPS